MATNRTTRALLHGALVGTTGDQTRLTAMRKTLQSAQARTSHETTQTRSTRAPTTATTPKHRVESSN
jgi:hypothetical protein